MKKMMFTAMILLVTGCTLGGSINAGGGSSGVGVGLGIGTGIRF